MKKVLVAGASRGIGLALVKAYLERGCEVVAAVRTLGNEHLQSGVSRPLQ